MRRRATRWAGVSEGLGVGDGVEDEGGGGAGWEACGAVGVKRVKVSDGLRDMVRRGRDEVFWARWRKGN